jgi:plasmid stabilization system protein ParE
MPERFIARELPLHMRWQYYYYSLWAEQKSRYVTELVRDVHLTVKSIKPQAILSAAVFPDPEVAYYLKGQDWPTWMAQGYLDLIVPMAYHGDQHRVMAQMAEAKRRAQGRAVFAGLGAWIKEPAQIRQEVKGLKEIGIDGFAYFSYQGMKDQDEKYIKQIKHSVYRSHASPPQMQTEINTPSLIPETDDADLLWRSLKKQFFSLEDYQALLDQLGMDENGLRQQLGAEVAIFDRMTKELYKKALPSPDDVVLLPRSVDLQGIFRYVHPQDGPQTREAALQAVQEAHRRLMAGEDFVQVAEEFSGGALERFYLQDGWDLAEIISAFHEGEITPVIEVPKGYRIYKIVKFHPPEQRVYGELPWWLKRVAFQERFARMVKEWE